MERKVINNAFYDELHEQWYESEDHPIAILRAEHKTRLPWIISKLGKSVHNILDVGCGGGFLTNALAQKGYTVTGVDLSEGSLRIARQRDTTGKIAYQMAHAESLPFEDRSFDAVSALDLLEHVDSPERVIQEASRLLKPGGIFFFHTFNRTLMSWFLAIKGIEWCTRNAPKNIHVYHHFIKPQEMKVYCQRHQLKVSEMTGLAPKIDRAFLNMLVTRKVSDQFRFQLTRSLNCGYLGYAIKELT